MSHEENGGRTWLSLRPARKLDVDGDLPDGARALLEVEVVVNETKPIEGGTESVASVMAVRVLGVREQQR